MNDPQNWLLPEENLIISLCHLSFSDEERSEVKDEGSGVKDWDRFTDLANRNGVIALCRHNITEADIEKLVPSGCLETLHSAYLRNLARNTFLYSQLAEVISLAKEEGIRVVLLKGAALEKTVYGNTGLRQMTDIDLLVRQGDAIRLRKKLLNNGFESAPLISPLFEKHIFPYGKHLPEMYRNGISVELHFRLFEDPGNHLTGEMSDTAHKLENDNDIYIPDPLLFFLYLIKHLDEHEKEGTSQLRLYTDLAVMLSCYRGKIINDQLIEKAHQANLEAALFEKLQILEIFWGISFPVWITININNVNQESNLEKFIRFFRHADEDEPHPGPQKLFKPLGELTRISDKILFLTGYVFPSVSYMKYRYRARSRFGAVMYYPVRWGRLAVKAVRQRQRRK